MDISELNDLEQAVHDLVALARHEVEQRQIEKHREEQIQKQIAQIKERLEPLLADVENTLAQFPQDENPPSATRQRLEETAKDLRDRIAQAPVLAAQLVDQQMILREERLEEERLNRQLNEWRRQLKADLMEMIQEQHDFFSATDAAVALRPYIEDLKAINALDELVEALMDQINRHSLEGPVAKLRGTYEQTLNFIYDKAMENRSRVDRAPNVQPRARHRTSEKRPNPYADLTGKVVVFGGHDRLETAVKNRLRDSRVELIWCTTQSGLQMAQQAEEHIHSADLVMIVTGYASHALTEKAIQSAKNAGITPEMINTTGMTRILEAIAYNLKRAQLANQINGSKS